MSTNENKRIARRIPAELSRGNANVLDEVGIPDGIDHTIPEGMPQGRESAKKMLTDMLTAFPDLRYRVEDEIAEGDLVVERSTGTGTMKGPWMGFQPTGRKASWTEIHILRFRDGKIVEHWGNLDMATMMMQLGLVPMAQQQPATAPQAGR